MIKRMRRPRPRPSSRSDNPFAGTLPLAERGQRDGASSLKAMTALSRAAPEIRGARAFLFKPPARRIVSTYSEPIDQFHVTLSGSYFATFRRDGREARI